MTKHVFEMAGRHLFHYGEYIKETKHFVMSTPFKGKEQRVRVGEKVLIIDCEDPKAICAAYEAEWQNHVEGVSNAREAYRLAQQAQREAALEAALAISAAKQAEG